MPSYQCLMVRVGSSSLAHSLWVKNEMVRLACESRSSISTRLPRAANPAPTLAVSVVLPTPPLWLMTETTFTVLLPRPRSCCAGRLDGSIVPGPFPGPDLGPGGGPADRVR